jgi:hypothetical protein
MAKRKQLKETIPGLPEFLTKYKTDIRALRIKFEGNPRYTDRNNFTNLIGLSPDGPLMLDVRESGQKLVDQVVAPSNYMRRREKMNLSVFPSLVDQLYIPRRDSVDKIFFKHRWMIDPLGDGNCGFYALKLFLFFLNEERKLWEPLTTDAIRKFLHMEMKDEKDYYLASEIVIALSRPHGTSDATWSTQSKLTVESVAEDEYNDWIGIWSEEGTAWKEEQLYNANLVAFARKTKTRIVLHRNWANGLEPQRYTTTIMDFRQLSSVELDNPKYTPMTHFNVDGIPEFEGDWFRTLVLVNSHTCTSVDAESGCVQWRDKDGNDGPMHYTMWIPRHYDPEMTTLSQFDDVQRRFKHFQEECKNLEAQIEESEVSDINNELLQKEKEANVELSDKIEKLKAKLKAGREAVKERKATRSAENNELKASLKKEKEGVQKLEDTLKATTEELRAVKEATTDELQAVKAAAEKEANAKLSEGQMIQLSCGCPEAERTPECESFTPRSLRHVDGSEGYFSILNGSTNSNESGELSGKLRMDMKWCPDVFDKKKDYVYAWREYRLKKFFRKHWELHHPTLELPQALHGLIRRNGYPWMQVVGIIGWKDSIELLKTRCRAEEGAFERFEELKKEHATADSCAAAMSKHIQTLELKSAAKGLGRKRKSCP